MAVRDVIISPGSINPYSKLKDEVIARCGESKSQEIRRLLAGEQIESHRNYFECCNGDQNRTTNSNIFSIKTHVIDNDFPNIVKPPCANQAVKHNVVHYIDTFGPPVCAKPRRMAPDRLKIEKMEFQHMLDLGHMRPSSSYYSSPLHMVPKKESNDWRF
ncbi:transposon Ty3-I Gag-Pol polyprotein [Trichonephila clavipes]|nr:transposon Ty3-I Gag-Pol polyprotein [Trichonephila clavipes]